MNQSREMLKIIYMKLEISHKRHIAKTITWRLLGTIDTIIISWFLTNNWMIGFSIGGVEVISKMILYYIHERLWYKSNFGIKRNK